MSHNNVNYSNTIIYKIQHNEKNELIYVGHTINFNRRNGEHKKKCKSSKLKLYKMIRDNGGWDSFSMVVVEEYPCYTKIQASKREAQVMRELKATMNTYSSIARIVDKDELNQKQKKYRQKVRDEIYELKMNLYYQSLINK